jgi:hypothetical protein
VDSSDFKSFVFPILFFKWISDTWDAEHAEALAEVGLDISPEEEADRPVDVWYLSELTLKRQCPTQVQQQSAATTTNGTDPGSTFIDPLTRIAQRASR